MKRVRGHAHPIYALAFSFLSVYFFIATLLAVQTVKFARLVATQTTYGSYLTKAFTSLPKLLLGL